MAISIIATVGFIPISIVTQHLIQNALTPNRVKANLLAQEVIEYVRYTRDSDVLDSDPNDGSVGGDWFDTFYEPNTSSDYRDCVTFADDWIGGVREKYCKVVCFAGTDETTEKECGTTDNGVLFDGFVAGVTPGESYGDNTKTCDGEGPEENNQFTTTLNIIIPREKGGVQYAVIVPCVSWSDRNGAIKKIELKETVFEWIRRE